MTVEYNNHLNNLHEDDVLDIDNKLFKSKQLKFAIEESFTEPVVPRRFNEHIRHRDIKVNASGNQWFEEGIDCKILKATENGWKKGKLKIKVSVEFVPDEPEITQYESPLKEIRDHPSFSNS